MKALGPLRVEVGRSENQICRIHPSVSRVQPKYQTNLRHPGPPVERLE